MSDPYIAGRIGAADTDALKAGHRKVTRRGNIAGLVAAAGFLAGVWLDWRWFPTALIPLAVCGFYGWIGSQLRQELAKRTKTETER